MTTQAVIRYRVKPERVPEHLELLGAVFDELATAQPTGLRWDSYQLEDGVSFVDVAAVDAPGTLSRLTTWAGYRSTLDESCDEPCAHEPPRDRLLPGRATSDGRLTRSENPLDWAMTLPLTPR